MIRQRWAIGLVVLALLATGCAKKPTMTSTSAPAPTGAAAQSKAKPPDELRPASQRSSSASSQAQAAPGREKPGDFRVVADLVDIHFDFDKYDIRPDDKKTLDKNAAWLKEHANQLLLIEGHCDERGTNEYNIALGDRRAKSTMNYLVSQGVAAKRISLVSYGEERPLCTEHAETCWTKNRRAHFLVKPE